MSRQFGVDNWNILSARINEPVTATIESSTMREDSPLRSEPVDKPVIPPAPQRVGQRRLSAIAGTWRRIRAEAMPVVAAVLLVLVSRTVMAQPFYVPSGSMEPTLQIGDELLASKYAYGYSRYSLPVDPGSLVSGRLLGRLPARGDVVVFRLPRDTAQTLVKRVIGLPGDHLQMRGGQVWINGAPLPLRADGVGDVEFGDGRKVAVRRYIETLPDGREHPIFKLGVSRLDDTMELVVPADCLFMMGDNRDNSLDSRVPEAEGGVGFVPAENVIGRADVVLGSWDFLNADWKPANWVSRLRTTRFFSRIG